MAIKVMICFCGTPILDSYPLLFGHANEATEQEESFSSFRFIAIALVDGVLAKATTTASGS